MLIAPLGNQYYPTEGCFRIIGRGVALSRRKLYVHHPENNWKHVENLFSWLFRPSETTFFSCCWEFNEIIHTWEITSMFVRNVKEVFWDLLRSIFSSGCAAHGIHISQMKKIWTTDFPNACASHATVPAEARLRPLSNIWPWVMHRAYVQKRGEEEGSGRGNCTYIPAFWGYSVPWGPDAVSLLLWSPFTATQDLKPVPQPCLWCPKSEHIPLLLIMRKCCFGVWWAAVDPRSPSNSQVSK